MQPMLGRAKSLLNVPNLKVKRLLNGGLSHQTILVSSGEKDWVVKQLSEAQQQDTIAQTRINNSLLIQNHLAKQQLCSTLVARVSDMLVFDYLPGEPLTHFDAKGILRLLAVLHHPAQSKAIAATPSIRPAMCLSVLFDEYSVLPEYSTQQQYIVYLTQQLAKFTPQVTICHGDLGKENLIQDATEPSASIKLIDLEYAFIGEPFFDLAALFESFDLSPQKREQFLLQYLALFPDVKISQVQEKLNCVTQIYRLLSYFWYTKYQFNDLAATCLRKLKNQQCG